MRHALAAFAFLLCTLSLHVHAQDPAYVDGPEPDPARADGGVPPQASRGRPAQDHAHEEQAQAAARTQEQLAAQIAAAQAAAAAQAQQPSAAQDGYADPPIGGRSMLREIDRYGGYGGYGGYGSYRPRYDPTVDAGTPRQQGPVATPGQQIGSALGSGLIQDAAGIADSHLQRKINGDYGRVIIPRYDEDGGTQ